MTETRLAVWQGHKTLPVRSVGLCAVIAVVAAALAYVAEDVLLWTASTSAAGARGRDDADLQFVEQILSFWRFALVAIQVVALVLVIIWMRRARLNLDAFPGTQPTLGNGWLVVGWLVPVANLAVPGRMMATIARESVRSRLVSVSVWLWWVGFVVLIAGTRIFALPAYNRAFDLSGNADLDLWAEHYRRSALDELWPVAAGVLSAICFALVVTRISQAQEERIARGRYEEHQRRSGGPSTPDEPVAGADTASLV